MYERPTRLARAELPPGREIENDPGANACFGCGPDNAEGLRLRFFDDGEVVRAPLDVDERYASWPGFANMGIVLTGMMETGAWAVWERLGPSRLDGPLTFEQKMPGMVAPTMLEARVDVAGAKARIDVSALQRGREVARASWGARRAAPEEARQLLRSFDIPRSLREGFEERAAERAS